MMDWTDRYCRRFHRLLSQHALLYTEMVTTGALIHGDQARHLDFDACEHPVALQLGGSEPADLARCARLGERWGYDEINLNCGCPSERVQRGAFGACLMAEPELVRDLVKAMVDVVSVPVTVKHRIGLGRDESYSMVRDFVGTVAQGGASVFIVHARNAWLEGLSPRENREKPPLRYEVFLQLQTDFPELDFVLNGGLSQWSAMVHWAAQCAGIMVGREAYQSPWCLTHVDREWFGAGSSLEPHAVIDATVALAQDLVARGEPMRRLTRHMLGLFNGWVGARRWRQMLSDPRTLAANDPQLIRRAFAGLQPPSNLAQPGANASQTTGLRQTPG
jgi:tRNA-dihydrouridine synthase A